MGSLVLDLAHVLAGGLVLLSFVQLYQDRLYALLNTFALHAFVLALSVAWQAFIQDAPHLYVTAGIALVFKAIVIPVALHRIIQQLRIHREIEPVVVIGLTMLVTVPRVGWWMARCLEWCGSVPAPDKYADQKYLDDLPRLFGGVVCQHPDRVPVGGNRSGQAFCRARSGRG